MGISTRIVEETDSDDNNTPGDVIKGQFYDIFEQISVISYLMVVLRYSESPVWWDYVRLCKTSLSSSSLSFSVSIMPYY